jgi:hypothetical protein
MKIFISRKTRRALLDMGFPRQSINNWVSGRVKPSRLSLAILKEITGRDYTPKKQNGKAA